ncbi:M56 family metallopeptidase [Pedobacter frigoris]|uniref:M56 family metallopeptidase n=1 Tax=Pedobacter frigoris TaxID=2571272 RepID=UPI00292D254C|nr:M56 family metallopeptidase [Pedobacter frigoris]
MEQLITYLLKSTLCIAVFSGIYWCFLKNETFYKFNRYFLLCGLLCAMALPFYTYTYTVNVQASPDVLSLPQGVMPIEDKDSNFWLYVALITYMLGICFLIARHFIGLGRIKGMIRKYGYTSLEGYKLVKTPAFKTSFSVFNYIIIDSSAETSEIERKLILEHELAHVKQQHWIDLLVVQLFCALHWFNPLSWLYLHAIKQNHEFLADTAVLDRGNSAAIYRAALINHSLGTPVFALASSFSHYDKLKRVRMMMKPASSSMKKLTTLILLPALSVFFWAFAEPDFIIAAAQKSAEIQYKPLRDTSKLSPVLKTSQHKKTADLPAVENKPAPAVQVRQEIAITKLPDEHKTNTVLQDTTNLIERPLPLKTINSTTQPLYILDGVEVASVNVISPNDIESITVLKNESATTNYGERGKNGVILIVSKPK